MKQQNLTQIFKLSEQVLDTLVSLHYYYRRLCCCRNASKMDGENGKWTLRKYIENELFFTLTRRPLALQIFDDRKMFKTYRISLAQQKKKNVKSQRKNKRQNFELFINFGSVYSISVWCENSVLSFLSINSSYKRFIFSIIVALILLRPSWTENKWIVINQSKLTRLEFAAFDEFRSSWNGDNDEDIPLRCVKKR